MELWLPYYKKYLVAIELIQVRFTKHVQGMAHLSYSERLQHFNIPSLWWRFARGSLINTYKILTKDYGGPSASTLFNLSQINFTRGHPLKLNRPHVKHVRALNFFNYRVIDTWNSLPYDVVCAPTINLFKNKLDAFVTQETNWFTFFIE